MTGGGSLRDTTTFFSVLLHLNRGAGAVLRGGAARSARHVDRRAGEQVRLTPDVFQLLGLRLNG